MFVRMSVPRVISVDVLTCEGEWVKLCPHINDADFRVNCPAAKS